MINLPPQAKREAHGILVKIPPRTKPLATLEVVSKVCIQIICQNVDLDESFSFKVEYRYFYVRPKTKTLLTQRLLFGNFKLLFKTVAQSFVTLSSQ